MDMEMERLKEKCKELTAENQRLSNEVNQTKVFFFLNIIKY